MRFPHVKVWFTRAARSPVVWWLRLHIPETNCLISQGPGPSAEKGQQYKFFYEAMRAKLRAVPGTRRIVTYRYNNYQEVGSERHQQRCRDDTKRIGVGAGSGMSQRQKNHVEVGRGGSLSAQNNVIHQRQFENRKSLVFLYLDLKKGYSSSYQYCWQ